MLAQLMPLLKMQMVMSLFTGRKGGFGMGRIMNMIMMMSMLPLLMNSLGSVS